MAMRDFKSTEIKKLRDEADIMNLPIHHFHYLENF